MELNKYQEEAVKNKIYGYGSAIIYPALGLGNEAGEVQGKIKKVLRDNGGVFDEISKIAILDELGDCLWYISALAEDLGYSLEEVAQLNLIKIRRRRENGTIGGSGDSR